MTTRSTPSLFPQAAYTDLGPFTTPLSQFLQSLEGRNLSPLTLRAYKTDLLQFLASAGAPNLQPEHVTRDDIAEYLTSLSRAGRSGVTRARKLAAIREFFRFLEEQGTIPSSPTSKIAIPKKERKARVYLRPDEFTKMLAASAGNPRDYAILQLFPQTGIRVSELCNLTRTHLDLENRTLTVPGKGNKERTIELEKKATQALKNYLSVRAKVLDDHLFLDYQESGLSDRSVRKIVDKYRLAAGITKQINCHSLRHTFGTYKASRVSPWLLRDWMGHASIATTQIYVHMARDEDSRKAMEATSL